MKLTPERYPHIISWLQAAASAMKVARRNALADVTSACASRRTRNVAVTRWPLIISSWLQAAASAVNVARRNALADVTSACASRRTRNVAVTRSPIHPEALSLATTAHAGFRAPNLGGASAISIPACAATLGKSSAATAACAHSVLTTPKTVCSQLIRIMCTSAPAHLPAALRGAAAPLGTTSASVSVTAISGESADSATSRRR